MIAENGYLAMLHDLIEALARIRAVPDDVSEAVDFVDRLPASVVQDREQRFEVPVDIANQRSLHWEIPTRGWWATISFMHLFGEL